MRIVNSKKKQGGFILTTELILIATILVIGMVVGMVTIRDAVTAEAEDVAEAIGSLNQSYSTNGIQQGNNGGIPAYVIGSIYEDYQDQDGANGLSGPGGDGVYFTLTGSAPEIP
jgi:hypothetical protein